MQGASAQDILSKTKTGRDRSDSVLTATLDAKERVKRLAEMLSLLWPGAGMYACRYQHETHDCLCVLDSKAQARPAWESALRDTLSRSTIERSASPPSVIPTPARLGLDEHVLAVETSGTEPGECVTLALALSTETPKEVLSALQVVLMNCACHLHARMCEELCQRESEAAREATAALSWLANRGELASPLAHEVNNVLNNIVLHLAVVEQRLPQQSRGDLGVIRQQIAAITNMMKLWHQCRQEPPASAVLADINRVIATMAREWCDNTKQRGFHAGRPPELELADQALPVQASVPDLRRLLTFLLNNAASLGGDRQPVRVTTGATADKVWLRVHGHGPQVPAEQLPHIFEPTFAGCPGVNSLEMAACRALVSRLMGKIRAESSADGGIEIHVEIPGASGIRT